MRDIALRVLAVIIFPAILAPFWVSAAGLPQKPSSIQGGMTPQAKQAADALQVLTPFDQKTRRLDAKLLSDCESVGVASDEIRNFKLKPEVQVTRDQFFVKYRDSLGLGSDAMTPGLLFTDKHGMVHSRWNQTHQGLPVLGMSFMLHEKGGFVVNAYGRAASFLEAAPTPTLTEAEALDIALNDIGATTYVWEARPNLYAPPQGQLAWSSKGYDNKEYKLVYRFLVSAADPLQTWDIQIEAKTGEVLNRFVAMAKAPLEPVWNENVPATGTSFYNGTVSFTADLGTDGKYRLQSKKQDGSEGIGLAANVAVVDDRNPSLQETADASVVSDTDNNFTDSVDSPGVSVKWMLDKALSYFASLGFKGWDGHGEQKILAYLRTLPEYPHAYYEPSDRTLAFNGSGNAPEVDMGTVGHEFTHGVVDRTSGLVGGKGEAPKLNEAFADIFGVLIRAFATGGPVEWRYQSDFLDDPFAAQEPERYRGLNYKECTDSETETKDNDDCYVHHDSTVISHAFYLIATGGQGAAQPFAGIGVDKMAEIAFLTMISLHSAANFQDARLVALSITESLYAKSSLEYAAVEKAFAYALLGSAVCLDCLISPVPGAEKVMPWPVEFKAEVSPGTVRCQIRHDKRILKWDQERGYHVEIIDWTTQDGSVESDGGKKYCRLTDNVDPKRPVIWMVRSQSAKPVLESGGSGIFGHILSGLKGGAFPGRGGERGTQPQPSGPMSPESSWEAWSDAYNFAPLDMIPTMKSPKDPEGRGLPIPLGWGADPWPTPFVIGAVPPATSYEADFWEGYPQTGQVAIRRKVPAPDNLSPGSDVKDSIVLKVGKKYFWGADSEGPDNFYSDLPEENLVSFMTRIPTATLVSPANNGEVSPWGVTLTWKPVSGAVGYKVLLADNPGLSNPTAFETTAATFGAGPFSSPRYWAVQPKGPAPYHEFGGVSEVWKMVPNNDFTKPILQAPLKSVTYHQPVTFIWKEVPNATQYQLTLFHQSGGACTGNVFWSGNLPSGVTNSQHPDLRYGIVTAEGVSGTPADKSGKCWQVTALGPNNAQGAPSEMRPYAIGPAKPVLISPPNGAQGVEYQPTTHFSWTSEYAPNGFVLHVSDLANHDLKFDTTSQQYDTNTLHGLLWPGSDYGWYVEAKGSSDGSQSFVNSDMLYFKTKAGSPAPQQQDCSPIASAPQSTSPGLTGVDEFDNVSDYVCYTQNTNKGYYKLQWQPVAGATQYLVTVKWYGDGSTVYSHEFAADEVSGSSTPLIPLNPGYEYGWQVSAKNGCMTTYGPASPIRYFECVVCSGYCGGYPIAPH